jgi:predicted acylesterase/phospholipase RssA
MSKQLFLYLQGGGIRAGVVCGMAAALEELVFSQQKTPVNRHMLASSGSAGTVFYWLSHLPHGIDAAVDIAQKIWINALVSPDFVRKGQLFGRDSIMDIDYLTEQIFREQHPLFVENIRHSPIGYAFPVWSVNKREIHWLTGGPMPDFGQPILRVDEEDPYLVLRAAKAIPFLYNRAISIGGEGYIDGTGRYPFPFVSTLASKNQGILLLSGSRKLVFADALGQYGKSALGYPLQAIKADKLPWSSHHEFGMRGFRHRRLLREVETLEQSGKLLVIEPSTAVTLGTVQDNSPTALLQNFQAGYFAVEGMLEEITRFVGA